LASLGTKIKVISFHALALGVVEDRSLAKVGVDVAQLTGVVNAADAASDIITKLILADNRPNPKSCKYQLYLFEAAGLHLYIIITLSIVNT